MPAVWMPVSWLKTLWPMMGSVAPTGMPLNSSTFRRSAHNMS